MRVILSFLVFGIDLVLKVWNEKIQRFKNHCFSHFIHINSGVRLTFYTYYISPIEIELH